MTTRPGSGDHIRVSDADRERAIDFLKTAFVQGRLTKDELGLRTGQALTSRTYGELSATTAAIPARLPEPLPVPRPASAAVRRPSGKKVAAAAACTVLATGAAAAFLTPYGGFLVLIVLTFICTTLTSTPPRTFRKHPFS